MIFLCQMGPLLYLARSDVLSPTRIFFQFRLSFLCFPYPKCSVPQMPSLRALSSLLVRGAQSSFAYLTGPQTPYGHPF